MDPPQIAVLDDDIMVLALMRDLLRDDGYQVRLERPHRAVVRRLRAAPPALVIIDIAAWCHTRRWPLLEQLRGDPTMQHMGVLVTTNDQCWYAAHQAALAALALHVLRKPFAVPTLLDRVAELLEARAAWAAHHLTCPPGAAVAAERRTGAGRAPGSPACTRVAQRNRAWRP